MILYSPRAINVLCCRHASGDPSHATSAKPFGGRQGDGQPVTVAVPPEPVHHPIVQTSTGADQPIADAHAADEPPDAGRLWRTAAAAAAPATVVVVAGHADDGPERRDVERGRRPALDVQTAAAVVGGHVLPAGGRHHQPVRRDGAQSPEGLQARLADRHPNTGARAKDLNVPRGTVRADGIVIVVVFLSIAIVIADDDDDDDDDNK